MADELHPYLDLFDSEIIWRFLIIGTFPPNKEERQGKSHFVDYYYGNRGSLWHILKETDLFPNHSFKDMRSIREWEKDYSVGITDVFSSCTRKEGKKKSSDDMDLVITDADLNKQLKTYILRYKSEINLIFFTSNGTTKQSNSAYYWLIQLMGTEFVKKYKSKFVSNLPSPSANYLKSRAIFSNDAATHGLNKKFFQYLEESHINAIELSKHTFDEKKIKVNQAISEGKKASSVKQIRFPGKDYPTLYRIDQYRKLFKPLLEHKYTNKALLECQ